jgi:hypothetical protein
MLKSSERFSAFRKIKDVIKRVITHKESIFKYRLNKTFHVSPLVDAQDVMRNCICMHFVIKVSSGFASRLCFLFERYN